MSLIHINWSPSKRELRKFGLTMIIGFGLLSGLFYYKGLEAAALVLAGAGVVFGLLGVSATRPGYWAYLVWMSVGFIMGNVVSRIVLSLFYYLILTPVSFAFKLAGRDRLQRKKKAKDTYWQDIQHHSSRERYERQY